MAAKLGVCYLFRTSPKWLSMGAWSVATGTVLRLSSDILSELLTMVGVRMARNSTKAQKTRALMAAEAIRSVCSQEEMDYVETELQKMEEKRKKNKTTEEDEQKRETAEANTSAFCKRLVVHNFAPRTAQCQSSLGQASASCCMI